MNLWRLIRNISHNSRIGIWKAYTWQQFYDWIECAVVVGAAERASSLRLTSKWQNKRAVFTVCYVLVFNLFLFSMWKRNTHVWELFDIYEYVCVCKARVYLATIYWRARRLMITSSATVRRNGPKANSRNYSLFLISVSKNWLRRIKLVKKDKTLNFGPDFSPLIFDLNCV